MQRRALQLLLYKYKNLKFNYSKFNSRLNSTATPFSEEKQFLNPLLEQLELLRGRNSQGRTSNLS